jgi:hypothetical protein
MPELIKVKQKAENQAKKILTLGLGHINKFIYCLDGLLMRVMINIQWLNSRKYLGCIQ